MVLSQSGGIIAHFQWLAAADLCCCHTDFTPAGICVIEMPDAQWCAFEIKLGANQIDAAAQSLLSIQKEIAADPKGKPPAVLCILCGMANAAYRRSDGVFVVPITALKP